MKITRPPKRTEAFFNAIFYGFTGSGKTHLLATAQECEATSPMMFINIDGGMLTMAGKKIDVVSPTNFKQLQEVYDFLLHDNDKYKSVAIDSLTEEQRVISLGSITGQVSEDLTFKDLGASNPPTRQDWLKSGIQMRNLVRAFKDLSYAADKQKLHVFMTCTEKVDPIAQRGVPALSGQLALEIGGYVDVLGHLAFRNQETDDGKVRKARFLYTQEHTSEDNITFLGKNRLGRLGRGVWDPTIGDLIELWTASDTK